MYHSVITIALTSLTFASPATAAPPESAAIPRVELAICLDTSGSMEGLIDAARQKLWAIVNDLALATPTPDLRVALLTFGNDGHDAAAGWVSTDAPFTTDLDLVSQRLFELSTNGGTEYVGRVLDAASRLDWTEGERVLRVVIVAGNEGADQDQEVRYREVCPRLIERGVLVNSIYCGADASDEAAGWREVARLADGKYAAIDQEGGTVVIESPFDGQLAELSAAVNDTYLWVGAAGVAACENQVAQDYNNASLNTAAAAQRAATKANTLYVNHNDLIDGIRKGSMALADVKEADLPEDVRKLEASARQAYIDEKAAERTRLQEQIRELTSQRDEFVRKEMERRALGGDGFEDAVRGAIREQAKAQGFTFGDDPAPAASSETETRSDGC